MAETKPASFTLPEPRLEQQFGHSKKCPTPNEAHTEANRCLYCYDAPCVTACPTAIDIPGFIRKIATGNVSGSAKTILRSNMLGFSCAKVCPVEELCVGACVLNDYNRNPIAIGYLQLFATQTALTAEASGGPKLFTPKPRIGKRVALIGAGPASLACAAHLALEGVDPTIFEKGKWPGGLNTTGVAPYKLMANEALSEASWLLSHGVELKTGVMVGKDPTLQQLREQYDAVFIGTGLGQDQMLDLPGCDAGGVWGATELIREIKNGTLSLPGNLRSVAVIGGGNTGIDIARELAMLGVANVAMLYRRTAAEMPGYAHEMQAARTYGVQLIERVTPTAIEVEGDQIQGVTCERVSDGSPYFHPCDWVVFAIGQAKHAGGLDPRLETDNKGRLVVDPTCMTTSLSGVYAGGDCVNGGKEVVNAAAHGRDAARAMLRQWQA